MLQEFFHHARTKILLGWLAYLTNSMFNVYCQAVLTI